MALMALMSRPTRLIWASSCPDLQLFKLLVPILQTKKPWLRGEEDCLTSRCRNGDVDSQAS